MRGQARQTRTRESGKRGKRQKSRKAGEAHRGEDEEGPDQAVGEGMAIRRPWARSAIQLQIRQEGRQGCIEPVRRQRHALGKGCEDRGKGKREQPMGQEIRHVLDWGLGTLTVAPTCRLHDTAEALPSNLDRTPSAESRRKKAYWPSSIAFSECVPSSSFATRFLDTPSSC